MIILVKVNKSYKTGMNPKYSAYRSWGCTRLLDDSKFRNQYKYLVAYNKKDIVGTFYIKGVSKDEFENGKLRKVKFLLEETDNQCDEFLKQIIYHLINICSKRIIKAMQFCYIDTDFLNKEGVLKKKDSCLSKLDNIPLLEPYKILYNDKILSEEYLCKSLPNNVWLRIKSIRSSYDSFRVPQMVERKTSILYSPTGNISFIKIYNSSKSEFNKITKIDEADLDILKSIFSTFYNSPTNAIDRIKKSIFNTHVTHYNGFEIEFDASSDEKFSDRLQFARWSGNVLFVERGFLKDISQLMF